MASDASALDRRRFLRLAGGTALASAIHGLARGERTAEDLRRQFLDFPIRIGVIGCGHQAMFNLIPNWLRIPGNSIAAVCDIIPNRLEAARRAAGEGTKTYSDYRRLLAETDVPAVIVATPPHTHRGIVEEAFRCERDVYCETPLALTAEDAWPLCRLAEEGRRVLQVGHIRRYHPWYFAASGTYFWPHDRYSPTKIHCRWNTNGTWRKPVPDIDIDPAPWGYPDAEHLANWYLYRRYSHGLMSERVLHQLEAVDFVADDGLPLAVSAVGRIDYTDGRDIFDNVHLIYEYGGDVIATFESILTNRYNPFGGQEYEMFQDDRISVVVTPSGLLPGFAILEPDVREGLWMPLYPKAKFENANLQSKYYQSPLIASPTGNNNVRRAGIDSWTLVKIGGPYEPLLSPYELALYEFKMNVLDRRKPRVDGAVGLQLVAAMEAGVKAMDRKERIEIEDVRRVAKPAL